MDRRRLQAAVVTILTVAAILCPLPAAEAEYLLPQAPPGPLKPMSKELTDALKGCFKTDPNGRKWPCSRINNPEAKHTWFACPIENRLGVEMRLYCDDGQEGEFYELAPGEIASAYQEYASVYDPAPLPYVSSDDHNSPNVTCQWRCAGNVMDGVVVWSERWPEAWSCRKDGGDGNCRLVFESNREVVLVTRAGRRVLGDLAIKECSKNRKGFGGWLPFGLGCTYPKHDHEYYGSIG